MIGWDYNSYGYHGDDGKKFTSHIAGRKYGPLFTTGDTIGVGINFLNRTIFFTKNGIHLGKCLLKKCDNLYPMIGMESIRESVEINFGQKQFSFDIYEYAKVTLI
ncbi:8375_t:CDS:2 [Funneliformis geosporum]|uniref:7645_t:CDS:1 n=1 Tax=Funneliformis geosporum TaxID=1117311 RepID=A0A9W4WQQ7_9GLOM|nr:7645_t:CDS:2 [Funneliformis geosporum]CAI2173013.1 8375_t:CDS:2 [Funneliformis geosporum]